MERWGRGPIAVSPRQSATRAAAEVEQTKPAERPNSRQGEDNQSQSQKKKKRNQKELEIKGIDPFASSLRTTRSTM